MRPRLRLDRDGRHILAVGVVFLLTRVYMAARGVGFDASLQPWGYQFIDESLLKSELLRSIWSLHCQPPLMNFAIGVSMKLFGEGWAAPLGRLFHLLGLLMVVSGWLLLRDLGASRPAATTAMCLLCVSPGTALYESWLFYTHPAAALLVFLALAAVRAFRTEKTVWIVAFVATAAAIVLLRSLFHPVWFLGVVAIAVVARPPLAKRIVAVAAPCALLILLLLVKNAAIAGSFSTSSWLGMSLARMVLRKLPPEEKSRLMEENVLTPVYGVGPWLDLRFYESFVPATEPMGFAALDRPVRESGWANYNHRSVSAISREYGTGAKRLLLSEPRWYFASMRESAWVYFKPTSEYMFLLDNLGRVRAEDRVLNAVLFGRFGEHTHFRGGAEPDFDGWLAGPRHIGFLVPAYYLLMFAHGAWILRRFVRSRHDRTPADGAFLLLSFVFAWTTFVGIAFEHGENNRFRALVEPLMFVWVAYLADAACQRFRRS